MTRDWNSLLSLEKMATGTPRQQQAVGVLRDLKIFEVLAPWTPALAGTIPLDVDTPESDLDILCHVPDAKPFEMVLQSLFGSQQGFQLSRKVIDHLETTITRFESNGFLIEIFAQDRPVSEQAGYRHMIVEARLLALAGPAIRSRVRELKLEGWKTEPAFAQVFGIKGDPYQTLYDMFALSDAELASQIELHRS